MKNDKHKTKTNSKYYLNHDFDDNDENYNYEYDDDDEYYDDELEKVEDKDIEINKDVDYSIVWRQSTK